MSATGVALRIATRDALAHKVRSLLVILLVGLPVLIVTVAMVIGRTADADTLERIPRDFGNAEAIVTPTTSGPVIQGVDARFDGWHSVAEIESWSATGDEPEGQIPEVPAPTVDDLRSVLGAEVEVAVRRSGSFTARVDGETQWTEIEEFDFASDITKPFYDLAEGTVPANADEAVVNEAFAYTFGVAVGDRLEVAGLAARPKVVGIAESTSIRNPVLMGNPESVIGPDRGGDDWLVDSAPVTWDDVKALNALGFAVTSRSVLLDPPGESEMHPEYEAFATWDDSVDEVFAVTALIVVMVLLEVALLAGPALAVTARQQSRTLALVTAAGGTPRQARAVVIAQGAVLGLGAALAGAVLGVLLGVLSLPLAQRFDTSIFGPLDIPWMWILGVVLVGAVAILVAAVVPAWITARQDPVRALAGRRADGNPNVGSPIIGLVLIAVGVVATVLSARGMGFPEVGIAASTIVVVLGALLVLPVLVVVVAKWSADLPLPFRFAARDAARHRGRTVPAIAAVAATVAGVIAVGITNESQDARDEATYAAMLPHGQSVVSWSSSAVGDEEAVPGAEIAEAVSGVAEQMGLEVEPVPGLPSISGPDFDQYWVLERPGAGDPLHLYGHSGWGSSALVADDTELVVGLTAKERAQIEAELAEGHAVTIFSPDFYSEDGAQSVRMYDLLLERNDWNEWSDESSSTELFRVESFPMASIEVEGRTNASLLVPTALAERAELPVEPVSLRFAEGLTSGEAADLTTSLEGLDERVAASVYTERGYEKELAETLLKLILVVAGGLLMLVGTLTATFLALSDAKPDLATMGAVGASPRRRRSIGGAYALLIAGVGAVIGVLIGLVPGITAAYVTTANSWDARGLGPFIEIPWLTVAAVLITLPLFTAGVVWASVRSRIPMVARID